MRTNAVVPLSVPPREVDHVDACRLDARACASFIRLALIGHARAAFVSGIIDSDVRNSDVFAEVDRLRWRRREVPG
ncbi:hypothetical protein [Thauera sp. WH-1]|uniref:hypothetical protein n=1 Tax=Thauera sp. WH-1 TaxID=3398230 RepID=UPI0039FCE10D